MIAALQAPLIMMSQNRAAEYDRLEAKNDYHVNLKSEEEIRLLHSKLDHIISDDNPNLFESQRLTVEVLGEMVNQLTETRQQLELLKATQDQANKDIAIDQKNGKLPGDIVDVAVMVTFTAAIRSTGVIRAH